MSVGSRFVEAGRRWCLVGLVIGWLLPVSDLWAQQPNPADPAGPVSSAAAGSVAALPERWSWQASQPLVAARTIDGVDYHAIKDPTIVRHGDRWHLFATLRGQQRSHAIVYLSFASWDEAATAEQHVLPMHAGFFCAPQVFYFEPHGKWYLICQASSDAWEPKYRPAFSTTKDLSDPASWSPLQPLVDHQPAGFKSWLDFWVICDDRHAHLFFTSLDGKMWRSETELDKFPAGWSEPVVALEGDIFEASHTYRLTGQQRYLTLIEAQGGDGWRYFKAYVADDLAGAWRPWADSREVNFASMNNVQHPDRRWTDCISHGELLRSGVDQRLEVDPSQMQFLFQGVLDTERAGKAYGEIPWRLGLLHAPVRARTD
ncbi:MAG: non-reducing end alpha-L-arabinofuranosidase family hydrolase [Pirellulales bacterium]